MSELALSIDNFYQRFIAPDIKIMAAAVRRELRRRRISRRKFRQMSDDERWAFIQAAMRR